ncbi:MAG: PAS domain S-box protein [Rhizobium sp.]|nr:PAS domain S-box protein [Rhizobium sp.]MBX9459212.1 PAS domain S-box protein [Rhizobium sp.]
MHPSDYGVVMSITRGMPGTACYIGKDMRLLFGNDAFLNALGLPHDEILGRPTVELFGEDAVASMQDVIARVLAGESVHVEGWSHSRYGDHYVRQSFTPFDNGRDGVIGYFLLAIDLTAQKRREEELETQHRLRRENEALSAAIVRTSLDSIIIIDGDGLVVDFNPAAEHLFGFTREQAIGRDVGSLIIPAQHRDAHYEGMKRYLSTGNSRVIGKRVELEAVTRDGRVVPVELSIADVSTEGKRFFTAHIRDLQPAKASQFEIERQRDALYQKEKLAALGSLLSGVAHELNNPLSIVLGQAMMLREKAKLITGGDDLYDRAQKIEMAANRCARIVRTFLAMARQRKAERSYVSVAKVIGDALELLTYSLRTGGVSVTTEIAPDLPETHADADLLHQVLVNLIVNAQQALESTGDDARRLLVRAWFEAATNSIVIDVADNGPGIPASIRNRIFDPFFTTKPQDHGTGIGLAVSRGLVEAHGGTLELLVPQPARGAAFVVRLPVTLSEDGETASAAPGPTARLPEERLAEILVVDDEPELAELIADIISGMGYRTSIAQSGHAAQRLLAGKDSDVAAILCDIRMPDGDGPGLYDWLATHRPTLSRRIAFVTGDTLGPSAGRFLARSGCPVIEKPFTPDDIAAVLRTLTAP